jgi:3D (Asp-Asp-Asp) domain-containing protein
MTALCEPQKRTMTIQIKVAVFAAFITITQLSSNALGDEKSKDYNGNNGQTKFQYCYVPVRVTTYHKSERGCDLNTKRGNSSTGIKLREGRPNVIGTIATDKKVIPIGSLVLVTTKNGNVNPYLSVDTGGAVVGKKASSKLAKLQGRSKEWATRPVVDIYSSRSITKDWSTVLVITDHSMDGTTGSERLRRLQERMNIEYWMPKGHETLDQRIQLLAYNK